MGTESEPTDPIILDTVEKLVLYDGSEVLLDECRAVHVVDGRAITGLLVDPVTLRTTSEYVLIRNAAIQRHVAMGFRNSDRSIHEVDSTPRSLQ